MAPPDATSLAQTLTAQDTAMAIEKSCVLRWWQTTAFVDVSGPDSASFLDGLCTQAVERIEPSCAVLGLFLDSKAKIIAPVVLHRLIDARWLDSRRGEQVERAPRFALETLADLAEPLRAHLMRYRLRARATVDATDLCGVAVIGERASSPAEAQGGEWTELGDQARPTHAFVGAADACAQIVRAVHGAGVGLADPDALEADRIERGVAGLHDLLPGRMPAEVGGMDTAVALDAGCYLGQEPVARLHYRGRANRTLRRLETEGDIAPHAAQGDETDEQTLALTAVGSEAGARPVGRLTTWARRPGGGSIALAVLRRELRVGDEVDLASGGGNGDSQLELRRLRVLDDASAAAE